MISQQDPLRDFVPNTENLIHKASDEQNSSTCSSEHIYVDNSKVHGIGVFANKNFSANETIEIFPIVPLSHRTAYQGDFRVISYSLVKQCECEECKRHGMILFLRLGYGGIYNHQDNNNAHLLIDYNNNTGKCIADRQILAGEEIFINYGLSYQFREGKNILKEE